jgi:hypothetical protein
VDADQDAHEVDVHHRQHVLERLVGEGPAAADAGVVVEDVHLAAGGPGEGLERGAVVLAVGHVEPAHQAVVGAQLVPQAGEPGLVDVEPAHEPALAVEQAGGLAPHAGRRTRDEDRLAAVGAHAATP